MLRSLNDLRGYRVAAVDGELGWLHDFFFDERDWIIRYIVVDVSALPPRRRVLLTAGAMGRPDGVARKVSVNLTREQVRTSPDVDTEKPVSRQMELTLGQHFGIPPYWTGPGPGVLGPVVPPADAMAEAEPERGGPEGVKGSSTLRSVVKITGYRVEAADGQIGHVEDFIADDVAWSIRHLAVDTRNWLPAKKVLVPPEWVQRISWEESRVHIIQARDMVLASPEYRPSAPANEEVAVRHYDYCGRPVD